MKLALLWWLLEQYEGLQMYAHVLETKTNPHACRGTLPDWSSLGPPSMQATRVRAVAWHPERADSAVTIEDRSVVLWRFAGTSAEGRPNTSLLKLPYTAPAVQKYDRACALHVHTQMQEGTWVEIKSTRILACFSLGNAVMPRMHARTLWVVGLVAALGL